MAGGGLGRMDAGAVAGGRTDEDYWHTYPPSSALIRLVIGVGGV